jgi:hypothetical protein
MSGDEDKGFFGNLMDDLFGDDEEKEEKSSGDGGSGGAGSGPSQGAEGSDGAGGMSSDDGGMSSDGQGGMSSMDDGSEGAEGMSSMDDGSAGVGGAEPNMSLAPPQGGTAVVSGGLMSTLGATDICLWPHAILRLLDVGLGDDVIPVEEPALKAGVQADFHAYYELPWFKELEFGYCQVEGETTLEFSGKLSCSEGQITPGWDQGMAVTLGKEFKTESGTWSAQPKLKFNLPTKNSDEMKHTAGIGAGGEGSVNFIMTPPNGSKEVKMVVTVEVMISAVEFEREHTHGAEWKFKYGNLEVMLSGGCQGTFKDAVGPGSSLEFVGRINGKVTVEPNWKKILQLAIEKFGEDLTFEALAAAAIPIAIVVGGIATIVIGVIEILEAWALADMRDIIIPARVSATTKGYMAGLRAESAGQSGAKVIDEKQSFEAGAAAGRARRDKVISEKCGGDGAQFDQWLSQNSSAVEAQTRAQAKVMLQKSLWTEKAAEYAGGHTTTSSQKLENQYYAWIYIIGSSPASMGGEWLSLWRSKRIACEDYPDRSAGNW